ncbi:MAG: hypothetical protein ACX939_04275 [Hyphococcus sp.]
MTLDRQPAPRRFTIGCTISVEHTGDSLEAHVDLDGDITPGVGDRIIVHGRSVTVPFGEKITIRRNATVTRANALQRLWVRLKSRFELTELYEVSFSPGRL